LNILWLLVAVVVVGDHIMVAVAVVVDCCLEVLQVPLAHIQLLWVLAERDTHLEAPLHIMAITQPHSVLLP